MRRQSSDNIHLFLILFLVENLTTNTVLNGKFKLCFRFIGQPLSHYDPIYE